MPKQPNELKTLASITRQLDALTAEERARVLAYLSAKYGAFMDEATGAK